MTKVLGLTGGIASGKTMVSDFFKSKNYPVIDADVIAHDVMRAGTPTAEKIHAVFGEDVIQADGEIDRKELGSIIFADPQKRKQLDSLVHSEVIRELERQKEQFIQEKAPLIVLDIPLLYEVGYENKVDEVMVVYVDRPTQKERLLKRNSDLSVEEAENRINAQLSLEEKAKRADVIVDNRGSREKTRQQVIDWLNARLDN